MAHVAEGGTVTYDDCLELMEAYTIAVCLERCLNDHGGMLPMARDVREKLEGFIVALLETSDIGPKKISNISPITVSPLGINPDPMKGWTFTRTSSDALDGKLS